MISQKCQYALRGIFELAKRYGKGPVKISEIAQAQVMPVRFLEVILSQLKQGGFVVSKRGTEGGYALARSPDTLTVGEVIRFVEGPLGPVECLTRSWDDRCPLQGTCVFQPMWKKVRDVMSEVYDGTTFQALVEQEAAQKRRFVPSYAI